MHAKLGKKAKNKEGYKLQASSYKQHAINHSLLSILY